MPKDRTAKVASIGRGTRARGIPPHIPLNRKRQPPLGKTVRRVIGLSR
jgi:hypothetical protein